MNRAAHFASVWCKSSAAFGIITTPKFHNIAILILDNLGAGHQIGVSQSNFGTWCQSKELPGWIFQKVTSFDKYTLGKGHFSISEFRTFWMILSG